MRTDVIENPPLSERDPLCNIEAEAALLGAMMQAHELIEPISYKLSGDDFFEPVHGRIFDVVVREHALGKRPTPVLLKSYFEADEELKELGGPTYLARLTADGQGLLAPRELTDQIADMARRRRMVSSLREAVDECHNLETDVSEIIRKVDGAIDIQGGETLIETDAAGCMDALLADMDSEHVGVLCKRIGSLDDLIGKLEPKSLTILAARPGMGKTAVATTYALGAASHGQGVLFVSLEMSREQLAGRMVADAAFDDADRRVPYTAIRDRCLNPWQRDRVNDVAKWISSLPLSVIDAGTLKVGRLARLVRSQKRKMVARGYKLDLVIVDYLQLLHPDERRKSGYEAISEISMALKQIAKDQGVAVMALAQLSRAVETRPDKRPILSDLRDSGQIEQDADAVLFLLREEYYLHQIEPQNDPDEHAKWEDKLNRCRGTIEFILAKRRNGTTGTSKGRFFGPYQAVR